MLGQLRTFIFTTQYDIPFGTVFTTIKELEDYIENNVPPEFHERLLIKPNKSVPGGKDYRLKTLIREFDKDNPLKNNDIQFIHSSDIGCKELFNHEFYHDKLDLDKRIAGEKEEWLMLIPKNKALAYIRQIKEFDKYIETTDERIPVSGKVNFTRLPIKPYTQAKKLIPIEKKDAIQQEKDKPIVIDWTNIAANSKKRKTKKESGRNSGKVKLHRVGSIYFGKDNYEYLGEPTTLNITTEREEPGVLFVRNGGKDGIFKAFEKKKDRDGKDKPIKYQFSPGVVTIKKGLEAAMGKDIIRNRYYTSEQTKKEVEGKMVKTVRMDFNIMIIEEEN